MKGRNLVELLENSSPLAGTVTGLILVGLVGLLDYVTGNEINISLFYLAPIVLTTWSVNQTAGLVMSVLSATAWLAAEYAMGQRYSSTSLYFWNTVIRSGFFVIVTYLVAELHKSRKEEHLTARTDYVSGAVNGRYFNELLQLEIDRIRRYPHPFTIVYLDVDNFKLVNDLFGHKTGDEVLRCIANELKSQLRSTDTVGRLGGDEFALLLPSTQQLEAQSVLSKVRTHLRREMKRRNLPVTFSIGAVTCIAPPHSTEQLISLADELMYEVKNSTKDDVRFLAWAGSKTGRY